MILEIAIAVLVAAVPVVRLLILSRQKNTTENPLLDSILREQTRFEQILREEFSRNREEQQRTSRESREEQSLALRNFEKKVEESSPHSANNSALWATIPAKGLPTV